MLVKAATESYTGNRPVPSVSRNISEVSWKVPKKGQALPFSTVICFMVLRIIPPNLRPMSKIIRRVKVVIFPHLHPGIILASKLLRHIQTLVELARLEG